MLVNLATALKRLFKVKSVNFIMQCPEAIDTLRKEGAFLKQQTHCHSSFYVIVPEEEDKIDYKLNMQFKNLVDVMKGKMFSGKVCVAPVFKLRYPDQSIMLVQMEHRLGSAYSFDADRDKKAFDILSKIIASIHDSI